MGIQLLQNKNGIGMGQRKRGKTSRRRSPMKKTTTSKTVKHRLSGSLPGNSLVLSTWAHRHQGLLIICILHALLARASSTGKQCSSNKEKVHVIQTVPLRVLFLCGSKIHFKKQLFLLSELSETCIFCANLPCFGALVYISFMTRLRQARKISSLAQHSLTDP